MFPATADDTDQQYVRVTLEVKLTPGYPDIAPEVFLRNPRGLDDDQLRIIMDQIEEKCNSCCGDPVIYDLIEVIFQGDTLVYPILTVNSYFACIYSWFVSISQAVIYQHVPAPYVCMGFLMGTILSKRLATTITMRTAWLNMLLKQRNSSMKSRESFPFSSAPKLLRLIFLLCM